MTETKSTRLVRGGRPKLLFLVTEDWYFWSHRLPMARAARDAGFDVAVATRVAHHGDIIEAEGFRLHPLTWRRSSIGLSSLAAILEVARLYRRVRPDIVHHVALKPTFIGAAACRFGGRPRAINALNGLGFLFISHSFRARLLRRLVVSALRLLIEPARSYVLVQNPDDFNLVTHYRIVPRDRIRLIPGSGIDIDHYTPMADPPAQTVVFALVARMLTSKGVPTAVDAIRRIRRSGLDVELHLIGIPDPENPDSLSEETLIQWDQEPGIRWLGFVGNIRDVWHDAHVAVLPSLREGFPKSLLEAAACGRPIIATDVPGCREIVKPDVNGYLVPPNDVAALADAMTALAQAPTLRARFGFESRRLVESDLAADIVGKRTVALYEDILSDGSRG